MTIVLAIILGLLFGFVLQKVGAANPQKIINMLRLKDFHLMKVILLGIGVSSLMLFVLLASGIIDPEHVSVKSSYIGVIIGGAILGLGWGISGFCPGTGVVGVGAGRKDAVSFIIGGLAGAFIYMLIYEPLEGSFLFGNLGGKATLAVTGNENFPALLPGLPGVIVAGVIAVIFIITALKLPETD
jgi:uncharacterized membrane protein YedE/YeeE